MLNIIGYGRLASDIKIKRSKDQKHLYTTFLLASHDNKETTFIRCVAFDGLATLLNNFFSKGDRIIVKGNLISDDYKGNKYVFKIQVSEFEFVETKEEHNKNQEKHKNAAAGDPIGDLE